MSNKILLEDTSGKIQESCEIEKLSIPHESIDEFLKNKQKYTELLKLAKEYNKKLSEIKITRFSLKQTKYAKDNLLCKLLEESKPPFYLKYELFNYKALVLYFMRNFRDNTVVIIPKIYLNIVIFTNTKNLFHLIDIPKENIQSHNIHERMIYDVMEFGDYTRKKQLFKSKVASLAWVKGTLENPDFIYDKSVNISQNFKFDLLFVRESGKGTSSQPYMYHLVGLKKIKNPNKYVIVSQFPIEKDRAYSQGEQKISSLHKYVQCHKPLFKKEGKSLPKYSNEKIQDENPNVNRLMNKFGS